MKLAICVSGIFHIVDLGQGHFRGLIIIIIIIIMFLSANEHGKRRDNNLRVYNLKIMTK